MPARKRLLPAMTSRPFLSEISQWTDCYFNRAAEIARVFGDKNVSYAFFMRAPILCAPRIALDWLRALCEEAAHEIQIETLNEEGEWVGAGEPFLRIEGSYAFLAPLETFLITTH